MAIFKHCTPFSSKLLHSIRRPRRSVIEPTRPHSSTQRKYRHNIWTSPDVRNPVPRPLCADIHVFKSGEYQDNGCLYCGIRSLRANPPTLNAVPITDVASLPDLTEKLERGKPGDWPDRMSILFLGRQIRPRLMAQPVWLCTFKLLHCTYILGRVPLLGSYVRQERVDSSLSFT